MQADLGKNEYSRKERFIGPKGNVVSVPEVKTSYRAGLVKLSDSRALPVVLAYKTQTCNPQGKCGQWFLMIFCKTQSNDRDFYEL